MFKRRTEGIRDKDAGDAVDGHFSRRGWGFGMAQYDFTARAYQYSSSAEMTGWTFAALPKELSDEIRACHKLSEEGWGRLKVTARLGGCEWRTAIWFDTKQDAYLLPLKASVRKQERVAPGDEVRVSVLV